MTTQDPSTDTRLSLGSDLTIPVYAEDLTVSKRQSVLATVRVRLQTQTHEQVIDELLQQERVDVERVAIGRTVDAVPAIREEGDTTIIPVVAEELVVERRLVLKEEIRLTRVRTRERHQETVTLREQAATVERTAANQPRLLEEQTP